MGQLAELTVAENRPAPPNVWLRWLPVWLPYNWLASLMAGAWIWDETACRCDSYGILGLHAARGIAVWVRVSRCDAPDGYQMTWPPSTRRSTPVTNDAAPLSRKIT